MAATFGPLPLAWNAQDCSENVSFSKDGYTAFFHCDCECYSQGHAAVRCQSGFSSGEHWWEVCFVEPPIGTSVEVGVATGQAKVHSTGLKQLNLVGCDRQGWSLNYKGKLHHNGQKRDYCPPFYAKNTVIGCYLNLIEGTLSFSVNGVDQGIAFTDIDAHHGPLYPIVSSSACGVELEIRLHRYRLPTLEDFSRKTILRSLLHSDTSNILVLPLPLIIKKRIAERRRQIEDSKR